MTTAQIIPAVTKTEVTIVSPEMVVLTLTKHQARLIRTIIDQSTGCLLFTSPSPRDATLSRMLSSV